MQVEHGLGDVHATWYRFPEEFPGKGLRVLHASAGATGRAHVEEHGKGCHLPVTVSPIMAGGAENVHLNEVVLQCP